MTTIAEQFAAAVRAARKQRRMSQMALAAEIGGSVDAVSAIERDINSPSLAMAAALVRVLQIDANLLFGSLPQDGETPRERLTQEAMVQRLARGLNDVGIGLMLELAEAVAKVHSKPPTEAGDAVK